MENPATWTPLHHEINNAYYAMENNTYFKQREGQIHNIMVKNGYNVSINDIVSIITQFNKNMENGMWGLSIPSTIINEFSNKKV